MLYKLAKLNADEPYALARHIGCVKLTNCRVISMLNILARSVGLCDGSEAYVVGSPRVFSRDFGL